MPQEATYWPNSRLMVCSCLGTAQGKALCAFILCSRHLQVYKYFRPLVQRSELKTMVYFASNFGSLTLASEPLRSPEKSTPLDVTQIAYKASKAAVNMGA